jgi:hypothetical protein
MKLTLLEQSEATPDTLKHVDITVYPSYYTVRMNKQLTSQLATVTHHCTNKFHTFSQHNIVNIHLVTLAKVIKQQLSLSLAHSNRRHSGRPGTL